jgi:hypothetical protein
MVSHLLAAERVCLGQVFCARVLLERAPLQHEIMPELRLLVASAPRVKLIYGSIVAMMGVWRIDPLRRCGCLTVTVRS